MYNNAAQSDQQTQTQTLKQTKDVHFAMRMPKPTRSALELATKSVETNPSASSLALLFIQQGLARMVADGRLAL